MKKATGSGNFFWEFYSYDVNVKKKFSNFSIYTTCVENVSPPMDCRVGW